MWRPNNLFQPPLIDCPMAMLLIVWCFLWYPGLFRKLQFSRMLWWGNITMPWGERLSRASPWIVGGRPDGARGWILRTKAQLLDLQNYICTGNLWGRSDGRCLLSLLIADGFDSWVTRRMGCAQSPALYWALKRRLSSLTDGTCKSRRIMAFGTYHGASAIKRRAFDWKRLYEKWIAYVSSPFNCACARYFVQSSGS
jgi:hypothetical protein